MLRQVHAKLSKRGFTLVEVMISLLIISILLLGLVKVAALSIDHNMRNLLRDEATRIAEQGMNGTGALFDGGGNAIPGLKTLPFTDARLNDTPGWVCNPPGSLVARQFRSLTENYAVCWRITKQSDNIKLVSIAVGWNWKHENALLLPTDREFQQIITSTINNPNPV